MWREDYILARTFRICTLGEILFGGVQMNAQKWIANRHSISPFKIGNTKRMNGDSFSQFERDQDVEFFLSFYVDDLNGILQEIYIDLANLERKHQRQQQKANHSSNDDRGRLQCSLLNFIFKKTIF